MITMKPRGSSTGGAGELHDITFTGCYFGAKNAEGKTGSPGMMIEIQDYSPSTANHGFYNINFTNCTFEAGNWTTIDYAGTIQGYAGGTILDGRSVVKGCLFKGMCAQGASGFGTGLCPRDSARRTYRGQHLLEGLRAHYRLQHVGRRRQPSDQQRHHRQRLRLPRQHRHHSKARRLLEHGAARRPG